MSAIFLNLPMLTIISFMISDNLIGKLAFHYYFSLQSFWLVGPNFSFVKFLFMSFPCCAVCVHIFCVYMSCLYSKDIDIYLLKMKSVDLEMPSIFSCASTVIGSDGVGGERM